MKKCFHASVGLVLLALLFAPGAMAQDVTDDIETDKLAQTGFKFLNLSVDARAAAMGDAMTAVDDATSSALFYNPAGMARLTGMVHAAAGQVEWIADIKYNNLSVAFRPGNFGVIGLSAIWVDYGEFIGTLVDETAPDGYQDFDDIGLDNPAPTAMSFGLGYAKALTDRFSVGGHAKYAKQELGDAPLSTGDNGSIITEEYSKSTVAVDFGVLYRTGFRSLNFAMSARNFSRELKYVQDNFELPLTFRIGVSMDVTDLGNFNQDMHSLLLSVDAERPRDFSEQLRIGGEYRFMNLLALRAGYVFPTDEQGINLGAGLNPTFGSTSFGFNYAFTSFGTFDPVHRFGLQVGF